MINWDIIKNTYEMIRDNNGLNRMELFDRKVVVYAVPTATNKKNVIRIDIKPPRQI